jgi:hypothetical protein
LGSKAFEPVVPRLLNFLSFLGYIGVPWDELLTFGGIDMRNVRDIRTLDLAGLVGQVFFCA